MITLALPSGALGEAGIAAGAAVLSHELSPWNMFLAADLVVKGIMAGLAFASLLVWTVWLCTPRSEWCTSPPPKTGLR